MNMRRLLTFGLGGWLLHTAVAAPAATWHSNFDAAKAAAGSSGRPILMNFTGSDWCPACIQLRQDVLSQPEFLKFADDNLVLMEVDFPQRRPLAALHQLANQQLARQYGIAAYPTLLLVDATGKPLARVPTVSPASRMVSMLSEGFSRAGRRPASPPPDPSGTRPMPAPVRELPLFGGAATQPLPTYTNLTVKSISGSPARRFALINSETLAAGESAWFKLGAQRVQVHCVEIREKSVLVRIEGDTRPRELLLSDLRN